MYRNCNECSIMGPCRTLFFPRSSTELAAMSAAIVLLASPLGAPPRQLWGVEGFGV